jgi:hypothetical protein
MGWTSTQLEREMLDSTVSHHHRLYNVPLLVHIFSDYFSNLAEQQLSVPSREEYITHVRVFSSLSPDQYHADNIPPLNTETISAATHQARPL